MNDSQKNFRRLISREGPKSRFQLQQRFGLSLSRTNVILRQLQDMGHIEKKLLGGDITYCTAPKQQTYKSVNEWLTSATVQI